MFNQISNFVSTNVRFCIYVAGFVLIVLAAK